MISMLHKATMIGHMAIEANEHEHKTTPDQAEEERTVRASCAEDAAKPKPKFLDEKTCLETHGYKVKD